MHTLLNNSVIGFRAGGSADAAGVWRAEPSSHRLSQIGVSKLPAGFRTGFPGTFIEQHLGSIRPGTPELLENDFPFSALIQLVRSMRE